MIKALSGIKVVLRHDVCIQSKQEAKAFTDKRACDMNSDEGSLRWEGKGRRPGDKCRKRDLGEQAHGSATCKILSFVGK